MPELFLERTSLYRILLTLASSPSRAQEWKVRVIGDEADDRQATEVLKSGSEYINLDMHSSTQPKKQE